MAVLLCPNHCMSRPSGGDWRSLGTIRVHFRPYGRVLGRPFVESRFGNQVWGPGLGAAAPA